MGIVSLPQTNRACRPCRGLFEFVFGTVGDDDVAALGELCEVVSDLEAIEVAAIGEGWFVDNNLYAFTAEIFNNVLGDE